MRGKSSRYAGFVLAALATTLTLPSHGDRRAITFDQAIESAEHIVSGKVLSLELLARETPDDDFFRPYPVRVDALFRVGEVVKGNLEPDQIIRIVHIRETYLDVPLDISEHPSSGVLWFLIQGERGTYRIVHGDAVWEDNEQLRSRIVRMQRTEVGYTPLFVAQNAADVSKAVREGVDVNEQDHYGRTALHWAVENDRNEVVRALLEAGARTDLTDGWLNVLDRAIALGREEVANTLREWRARAQGLFLVAGNLPLERFDYFLSQGADVNVVGDYIYTPLLRLVDNTSSDEYWQDGTRLEKIRWLLKHGAQPSYPDMSDQPLSRALAYCHKRGRTVAGLLLAAGANVNALDFEGGNILKLARLCHDQELIVWLIDNGADVNAVDDCGVGPLFQYLNVGSSTDIVKILLEAGANPVPPEYKTLSHSCQYRYYGGWFDKCGFREQCQTIMALLDEYRIKDAP